MESSRAGYPPDRCALVCGASSGIGRASALALAGRGFEVVVLARSMDALVGLLPALVEAGAPRAEAMAGDLDDRPGLSRRIDELIGSGRVIHALVNNAGGPPAGPILQAAEEDFVQAFGRHVLAPHLLVTRLLPGMAAAGFGRIINIVSTSVREPLPGLGVSNTVRGAVAAWAKSLSRELPPGVTINNVLPGFTRTPRLEALATSRSREAGTSVGEIYEQWGRLTPEGRIAEPGEIAEAVAFLASPAAGYIRGVSLPVDGGRLHGI